MPLEGACHPCRAAVTCCPMEGWQAARPPGRGAAGSPPNIKAPFLTPSFTTHEIQRGERERGGMRVVIPPAKPCRILDPNRR